MEVKYISSSLSVSGCGNQRQKQHLASLRLVNETPAAKCSSSEASPEPPAAGSQRCRISESDRSPRPSESRACLKFPWQQNALGGQTHQISEQ